MPTDGAGGRDLRVVVVGAGPAGISAAIHLHRSGVAVDVVDKAEFPRDKICGDGLTTSALRELEALGLDPATVPSWCDVDRVVVASPSGESMALTMPQGRGVFAATARRRELDAALVALARREGVPVHENHSVESLHPDPDSPDGAWLLTTAGPDRAQRWPADIVIAADGMWSPTRKLVGIDLDGYRGDWHAFRQYLVDVTPTAASELFVSFEADLLPGYFWSFPLADGVANVGFGIQRGEGLTTRDMKWLWPDLLERPHIRQLLGPDARPEGPHRAWPIPSHFQSVPLCFGRIMWVGDAAGVCDPLTGEGIGQALQTGRWAAESTVDAIGSGRPTDDIGERYAAVTRSHYDPDHRMSRLLIRALRHRKGARAAIRVASTSDWTRRHFVRWLFEDYPRGIAFTPSRWRRGLLEGGSGMSAGG